MSTIGAGLAGLQHQRSDAEKANLDYSAFLRLFVASMKNQDPTKPNDPSQTLAQLASFSNVEQSIKLNEKLDQLVSASSAAVAASIVGKRVSSLDDAVSGLVTGVQFSGSGIIAMLKDGGNLDLSLGYKLTGS